MEDLTKPFVKTYRDGDDIIIESNLPNDTIGDFAFEWDLDGSKRAAWEARMQELERQGIKGQLFHHKIVMKYNAAWDGLLRDIESPKLESYNFGIIDLWPLNKKENDSNTPQ